MLPSVFPTVVHLLADTVARCPAREALVIGGERLRYADLLDCVAGFASELAALGRGRLLHAERIAILLPNSIEICIATWAAHAAGAQVVPLNPLYTERELEAILADAAPAVLIHDASNEALVDSLVRRLRIRHAVAVVVGGGHLTRWKGSQLPLPQPMPAPDDLAFVQYTGGTTGR